MRQLQIRNCVSVASAEVHHIYLQIVALVIKGNDNSNKNFEIKDPPYQYRIKIGDRQIRTTVIRSREVREVLVKLAMQDTVVGDITIRAITTPAEIAGITPPTNKATVTRREASQII